MVADTAGIVVLGKLSFHLGNIFLGGLLVWTQVWTLARAHKWI